MSHPYDDTFKQAAIRRLHEAGSPVQHGAMTQTAAELGIPRRTLTRWASGGPGAPPCDPPPALTDLLDAEIRRVLAAMVEARQAASYRELGTVLQILIDKQLVLSGAPTERTAIHLDDDGFTDEQRIQRIVELLDAARTRRTRPSPGDSVGEDFAT
jgi:transposase-like protein